jgi:DNA-binding NarL/FixJ family response regulator
MCQMQSGIIPVKFIASMQKIVEAAHMKILLAESDLDIQFRLSQFLGGQAELKICATAATIPELFAALVLECPDWLLVDWDFSPRAMEELLHQVFLTCPFLKVIVLGDQPSQRKEALAAGADAFCNKTESPERLLTTIQQTDSLKSKKAAFFSTPK